MNIILSNNFGRKIYDNLIKNHGFNFESRNCNVNKAKNENEKEKEKENEY